MLKFSKNEGIYLVQNRILIYDPNNLQKLDKDNDRPDYSLFHQTCLIEPQIQKERKQRIRKKLIELF